MGSARALRRGAHVAGAIGRWPPLVHFLLGIGLMAIWALGTSVQVLTSEAWMMHKTMDSIDYSAWAQLWDAIRGQLHTSMYIPFTFGWGVQFALIVASIGVELPRYPKWRFYLAWFVVFGLIGVNSCGDWSSSSDYGIWGQCGFTLVVFFITFVVLFFAIMAFKHAWTVMRSGSSQPQVVA